MLGSQRNIVKSSEPEANLSGALPVASVYYITTDQGCGGNLVFQEKTAEKVCDDVAILTLHAQHKNE